MPYIESCYEKWGVLEITTYSLNIPYKFCLDEIALECL